MNESDNRNLSQRKLNLTSRLARNTPGFKHYTSPVYEVSGRARATGHGGAAALVDLARRTGLCDLINREVRVPSHHKPYTEADHVMAIVAAVLSGGTCVESLRTLRQDAELLDSLGAGRLPDSTTAGDFLRRFDDEKIEALQEAILATTVSVLKNRLPASDRARVHGRHRLFGPQTPE